MKYCNLKSRVIKITYKKPCWTVATWGWVDLFQFRLLLRKERKSNDPGVFLCKYILKQADNAGWWWYRCSGAALLAKQGFSPERGWLKWFLLIMFSFYRADSISGPVTSGVQTLSDNWTAVRKTWKARLGMWFAQGDNMSDGQHHRETCGSGSNLA